MGRPDRLIRRHLRERYVVTMRTGEAFDGVLVDADDRHLILADAATIAANGDRVTVDGQLWLPRLGVDYMQALTK